MKKLAGAGVALAAAGGAIAIGLGIKAVKAASDLGEQINKTTVVFGKSSKMIQRFARGTASTLGISNEAALNYAGTFGNMLVPMGIARGQAASMSKQLVKLAADMASFNNASPEEVLEALRAGLAGETEPLRRFGVFLNEDRKQAEALASGLVKMNVDMAKVKMASLKVSKAQDTYTKSLKKFGPANRQTQEDLIQLQYAQTQLTRATNGTKPKLTAMQKAMATYNIIMRDTKDSQGDFSRTLGSSLPNAMRVLRAQTNDLMAAFGKGLIPVVMKAAQSLRKHLANPEVRAFLERLGYQVGTVLLDAFTRLGLWFNTHWPSIINGFTKMVAVTRGAFRVANQLKNVYLTMTAPLQFQLKLLLAFWDKVLSAIAQGADLLSKMPTISVFGKKIGGDNFAAVRDAARGAQGALKGSGGGGAKKGSSGKSGFREAPGALRPRARGGPVRPGASYIVGERGPEIFSPRGGGTIIPNGGGSGDVVINLDGREIARVALNHITRTGKRSAGQSRGRLGGQNLALG